jgi:hypothetical protein
MLILSAAVVYGAYDYDVQTEIQGVTDWSISPVSALSNRADGTWTVANFTYGVQVRTSMGTSVKSDWTTAVYVTVNPDTAPGPSNALVTPTDTGFEVSWDPVNGSYDIVEYVIRYFDQDNLCSYLSDEAFASSPGTISGLVEGHNYLVAVSTWDSIGDGFPEVLNYVQPGYSGNETTPAAPGSPTLISTDPTTVHITWDAVENAAGYRVWTRNVNNASSISTPGTIQHTQLCADIGDLFPGVWNFEFC